MNLGNAHQQKSLLAEVATSLMQKSNPACVHPANMRRDVYVLQTARMRQGELESCSPTLVEATS